MLFSEGLASVRLNKKWGFINRQGKTIIPFRYSGAWTFVKGRAAVLFQSGTKDKCGKSEGQRHVGFINRKGKLVIPAIYEGADNFHNGRALVQVRKDDKFICGFIDRKGKEVIPCELRCIDDFYHGTGLFEKDGKYFALNQDGSMAYPDEFEYYNDDYRIGRPYRFLGSRDKKDNRIKYGILDYSARTILPFIYDSLVYWKTQLMLGKRDGKWGAIHFDKGEMLPFEYQDAFCIEVANVTITSSGNCFALKQADGWVLYDTAARKIDCSPIDSFEDNFYVLECYTNGKVGLWHKDSLKWTIPPLYDGVISVALDVKAFKSNGKYGFLDIHGKQITSFRFDSVKEEILGFCPIREKNLWGFFDCYKRKILLEPQFDTATYIWFNRGIVRKNQCWGVINEKGSYVIPTSYDRIHKYGDSLYILKKDGICSLADRNGKVQTELTFTKAYPVYHPLLRVEQNGKTGYINKKGKLVIPAIYTEGTDYQKDGAYVSVRKPGSDEWIKLDENGWKVY